ncbi:hypothetical protein OF83DRAFT_1103355, partial [Amylostereum chailletii]
MTAMPVGARSESVSFLFCSFLWFNRSSSLLAVVGRDADVWIYCLNDVRCAPMDEQHNSRRSTTHLVEKIRTVRSGDRGASVGLSE